MAYDPSEFVMRTGPFVPPKKMTAAEKREADKAAIEDTKGAKPVKKAKGGKIDGIARKGKTRGRCV